MIFDFRLQLEGTESGFSGGEQTEPSTSTLGAEIGDSWHPENRLGQCTDVNVDGEQSIRTGLDGDPVHISEIRGDSVLNHLSYRVYLHVAVRVPYISVLLHLCTAANVNAKASLSKKAAALPPNILDSIRRGERHQVGSATVCSDTNMN